MSANPWVNKIAPPVPGETITTRKPGAQLAAAVAEIQDKAVRQVTSPDGSISITEAGEGELRIMTTGSGAGGLPSAAGVDDYKVIAAVGGSAQWDWVRFHA